MTGQHWVVLGDVVESRDIADREAFQEELQSTLASVNEEFAEAVRAPFTVLKGVDEIGGVLSSVAPVVAIQRRLALSVHPHRIRLVAVVGDVDVNPDAEDVSAMDGEAFARADAALAELESAGLTFALRGDEPVLDDLVSDQVNLLDVIRAGWTERQAEILSKYDELGTQKAVADALDVSPQAVSNAMTRMKGKQVLGVERRLAEAVELYPSLRIDEESK